MFKQLHEEAKDEAFDALEGEAHRRAVVGVLKPVYQGGQRVGAIREYSDTLLIILLKAGRPEKFRDRFEHVGRGGGPIETLDVNKLSEETLQRILLETGRETAPETAQP